MVAAFPLDLVTLRVIILWSGRTGWLGLNANSVFYITESLFRELGRQSYGVHGFPDDFHTEPNNRPHESLFQSYTGNVLISVDDEIRLFCGRWRASDDDSFVGNHHCVDGNLWVEVAVDE